MIPPTPSLSEHEIVDQKTWLAAREKHFADEVRLTHELDKLREKRRALPWVEVAEDYEFIGRNGPVNLTDLFDGRSQLVVQHIMLTPGSDHICPGCSFLADHVDCARQHFQQADLSYAAVSRAGIERIEGVRQRLGWDFEWVSSGKSSFSFDFGVSFTDDELAGEGAAHNYGKEMVKGTNDMFGLSVFVQPEKGGPIFHTYSTFRRGAELMMGALNWLDLTPKGRNEQGKTHSWLRLHDEY